VLVGLAAGAACFINPWGWKALWLPFEYALYWRNEPVFAGIQELAPLEWSINLRNGLPLLLAMWPVLAIRRAMRHGVDVAESLVLLLFTALTLDAQRFVGNYAVAAAPFVARDLAEVVGGWRWRERLASVPVRAACAALAMVLGVLPDLTRPELPIAIAFDPRVYPIGAMDWAERCEVRGRGFNQFGLAGYMLYRGWPDVERLPFMDIHQTGSTRDRYEYAWAQQEPRAWRDLDRRWRFDYAVLERGPGRTTVPLGILDADSSWVMGFSDDAAVVYLKRDGALRALADQRGYALLGGGSARAAATLEAAGRDTLLMRRLRGELDRMIADSPAHAGALVLLGHTEQLAEQPALAESAYRAALQVRSDISGAHGGLGFVALEAGRPWDAVREFQAEWDGYGARPRAAYNLATAYHAAGDKAAALRWYRKELQNFPANTAAADSLAALERGN
jgi:hypothetical protein